MSKFDDLWSDLESDIWTNPPANGPEKKQPASEARDLSELYKFTERCSKCGGTGIFRSYSGRVLGDCFSCKGKGSKQFKTSPEARKKARTASHERKVKQVADNVAAVRELYPAELEHVERGLSFDFFSSLYDQAKRKGEWSDGQVAAVRRSMLKAEQREAEKQARTVDVQNLAPIREAFDNAQAAGLKRPKLRVGGYEFSKAPDHGANAGHIYVKNEGEYLGKIDPDGVFKYMRGVTEETLTEVQSMAGDLLEAATAHGKRTGKCSCCGRELTKAASIEAGIGPVCAEKWGL
jgi:predicted RNA-binding Zn-ribbon protein involved in translation (DUF1610 family)